MNAKENKPLEIRHFYSLSWSVINYMTVRQLTILYGIEQNTSCRTVSVKNYC